MDVRTARCTRIAPASPGGCARRSPAGAPPGGLVAVRGAAGKAPHFPAPHSAQPGGALSQSCGGSWRSGIIRHRQSTSQPEKAGIATGRLESTRPAAPTTATGTATTPLPVETRCASGAVGMAMAAVYAGFAASGTRASGGPSCGRARGAALWSRQTWRPRQKRKPTTRPTARTTAKAALLVTP